MLFDASHLAFVSLPFGCPANYLVEAFCLVARQIDAIVTFPLPGKLVPYMRYRPVPMCEASGA